MSNLRRKLVLVGDDAVGKTCLFTRFACDQFLEVYGRATFETYVAAVKVDEQVVELAVWDTSSREDFDDIRPLSYPDSQVVLLAYSIDDPTSLYSIEEKWLNEVTYFIHDEVAIILVGCKMDLRDDELPLEEVAKRSSRLVTYEEGLSVAMRIGAGQFLECSAKTGQGVAEIFEVAARAAIDHAKRRKSKSGSSCVAM
ncbi:P-loop containing nucleoside triphosphate hydrolase protein [Flagelloscypha sp. PMI_526]|nr:P-loop containing nucleoside triphosphate hydrolase protein [Flagelloscypha sp. PMI_526]